MLDGAIMEYVKWFIAIISIGFIATVVVFMFQLNEVNSFQQEVNYQIERHGGLTEDALADLNAYSKEAYGGCLAASYEDGSDCLFEADRDDDDVELSGFFVKEIVEDENGGMVYHDRANDDQARYGESINYALTRQIGEIQGTSFFKPAVIGESASRVRGSAE